MSSASVYSYDTAYYQAQPTRLGDWVAGYDERKPYTPLLFLPAAGLSALSWAVGGMQIANDIAMIYLTVLLTALFLNELIAFPRRFGIGGLIAFGGALLWWCYDYHVHWLSYSGEINDDPMFAGNNLAVVPYWVLGKSVCVHALFLFGMSIGLQFRKHLWISRLAFKTVEPVNSLALFLIIVILFALSLIPYWFTTEGPLRAIYLSISSGRGNAGPTWTTGRSGNLNTNWGGYLAQLVYLGYAVGTLAIFHAVIFAKSWTQKIICFGIFGLQVALAFGTGARGNVVFVCLPLAIIFYLKYNYVAAAMAKRFSFRSYVVTLSLLCAMLLVIQVQGYFRNEGFAFENFKNVEVADLRGNEMFTTTIPGMALFPGTHDFIDEPFRGAGAFYAIPRTIYWFCINPIPRALWVDKPTDKAWFLYNSLTTGRSLEDGEGTTISRGAAGDPYFKWGLLGMIQIAVLYGWILRNCEVGMRYARHRVFSMTFLLGTATFIFRAFRDLNFHDYYPVVYGTISMMMVAWLVNQLSGGSQNSRMQAANY